MNTGVSNLFVDCHFHVFDAAVANPDARYVPSYAAPLSGWRARAEPLGVRRGVLVQTSFLGTDNSRLVRELQAHPDRLRGVAVVAPDADPAALRQLHAAGVRGLRLNLAQVSHDIAPWADAARLWDAMFALGWHLELHTDIGRLPELLPRLPRDLPVVIDHMGKPDRVSSTDPTVAALRRRASHAAVFVKLSGAYRLDGRDPAALARLWQQELGVQRLLWGSDWPWTNHERAVDYAALFNALAQWLGSADAHTALGGNAAALYWGVRPVQAAAPPG